MPRQSTRNNYKSRRERKQEHNRRSRIIFWGILILVIGYFLKDWREYWAYLKTYFMD